LTTAHRRSKPSPLARLRAFWIVALFAVLALAGALAGALAWPGFRLGAVEVAGNAVVPRAAILARASFERGRNVWLLDTGAAERRIEQIPYVETARVHRALPNALGISIVERAPLGCLIAGDGAALTIDARRRVLERGCARLPRPVFRVPGLAAGAPGAFLGSEALARLQADAAALQSGPDQFVAFALDGYGGLEATLASGLLVRFGADGDLPAKLQLLAAILADPGTGAPLRAIDLRAPSAPVVERRQPQHIQESRPGHHNI
jgi:cell division protein FtsQ